MLVQVFCLREDRFASSRKSHWGVFERRDAYFQVRAWRFHVKWTVRVYSSGTVHGDTALLVVTGFVTHGMIVFGCCGRSARVFLLSQNYGRILQFASEKLRGGEGAHRLNIFVIDNCVFEIAEKER